MVLGIARRLHQLADDRPGRGAVGVAHPEIHDVLLRCAQLRLHLIRHGEDVGRQLRNPVELVCTRTHYVHATLPACVLSSAPRACFAILVLGLRLRPANNQPSKEISAEELAKLLEQPDKIFFLDVREPAEIARLGSVKNYVNIPLSQLEKRIGEVPKDKLVVTL